MNTSGLPGTTTGGSRGRTTLKGGQDQNMGEREGVERVGTKTRDRWRQKEAK